MSYKFIVHTGRGRPDSLRQPVKIVFTLTPVDSKSHTLTHAPTVYGMLNFGANAEQMHSFEWGSELAFGTYQTQIRSGIKFCYVNPPCFPIAPGQCRPLIAVAGSTIADCGPPKPYNDFVAFKQGSVMTINNTGTTQNVALLLKDTTVAVRNFETIAVYGPLENDASCVAPAELTLQAYVVSKAGFQINSLLLPEDLTQPLFQVPLSCDALPNSSIWRLSQDASGRIQLRNDNQPELGFISPEAKVDALARSFAEMRDQLSFIEESVAHAQDGVDSGHQAVVEIQGQLSTIKESTIRASSPVSPRRNPLNPGPTQADQRVPALEAQTERLSRSFSQTQEYLSSVQKFLQNTRQQVTSLDGKFPAVEAKVDKLAETVGQTTEDVVAVKSSLGDLDLRVTAAEKKSEMVLESLEEVRDAIGNDDTQVVFPGRQLSQPVSSVKAPIPPAASVDSDIPQLPTFF